MIFVFLLICFSFNLNVLAAKNDTNSSITELDDADLLLMKNFNQENFDALLEKLGGTNWTNKNQKNLLHIAVEKGYYDASKALIKKDPRLIDFVDNKYRTAFHYAAGNGHCKILSLLIENGANVNALARYSGDDSTTKPHVSPLLLAAENGHTKCVHVLLDNKAGVNHQNKDGFTALHYAARYGYCDIISLLIEKGANVNVLSKYSNDDPTAKPHVSSLLLAAENGKVECVQILLDHGADVNHQNRNGFTALHLAAFKGHCDVVSLLIEKGADVNALAKYKDGDPTTKASISPLQLAARFGHDKCVKMLLDHGANVDHQDKDGFTALHLAAKNSDYDLVKILVETGADTSIKTNNGVIALELAAKSNKKNEKLLAYLAKHTENPVHRAVSSNDMVTLNALISAGIDVNTTNENQLTPLHIAASGGYYEAAKILINKDPKLVNHQTRFGWTALHYVANNGHCDIISLLIEKGANVNALAKYSIDDSATKPHISSLQLAADNGHSKCVKTLLKYGANVNHQNRNGFTALHLAAFKGHCDVVSLLIEKGADVNALAKYTTDDPTTKASISPLQLASKYGHTECVQTLLSHGASVDHQDKDGWAALHFAAGNGHCKILSLLIENGANVNALARYTDDDPTTKPHVSSLLLAARGGHVECVQILLDHGSNVNHKDIYEFTALHYAARYGYCDIISLLIEKGANVNALAKYSDDDPTAKPHVSSLLLAAENGKVECVQILLDHGADVNHQDKDGFTALHLAAFKGHCDVAEMLVGAGADTSIKTNDEATALELAAKSDKKNNKLIAYLAKHTENPVHRAVSSNDMITLNALISAGIDVNTTNENQLTPLHIAASGGYYEAAKILINKDPKLVNITDSLYWFPLHFAARYGNCDLIPLLLKKGANVSELAKYPEDSSTTKPSVSALQLTSRFGHAKCVQILLDHEADIEHKDHRGDTALQIATDHGRDEVAEILVAAGADRSVLVNKDRTGYIIVFLVTLLVSTIVGAIVLYLTRRWYKARLEELRPKRIIIQPKDLKYFSQIPIAHGSFGCVYKGKLNHNGQSYIVAIKKFIKFSANQGKYEEIYLNVEHDHITKILGICTGDGNIKLVTKWREDGALCYYLQKKRKDLKPVNLLTYCYQISQAMKYLGTKNITHCDLSTRNVLVKNEMHVEITDFGLARSIDKEDPLQDANATLSLRWAAIELLDPASKVPKFTVETDVWAFGVTCWEIFTFASEPYAELNLSDLSPEQRRSALYKHLKNNNFLVPPEICNFELKAIMSTCWTREPRDRPSFSDLTRNFNKLLASPDRYLKMDNNLLKKLPFVSKNNDTNNWHVTAQPLNPKEDAELDLKKEEQNNLVQARKAVITRTTSENSVLTNVQVPMKDVRFVLNGQAALNGAKTAAINQAVLNEHAVVIDQVSLDRVKAALGRVQDALNRAQVSNNAQLTPDICQIAPYIYQIAPESYQTAPENYQLSSDSGQSSLNSAKVSPESYQASPESYQLSSDFYQIAPESYQLSSDSGQSSLNSAKIPPDSGQSSLNSAQVSPESYQLSSDSAQASPDSGQNPTINSLNVEDKYFLFIKLSENVP